VHLFAGELAASLFYPRKGRVCVLAFYMDDSADKRREKIFVVGGFLGQSDVWFEAERHWKARVNLDGLDYFRTTEAISLTGEFEKLRMKYGLDKGRDMRDELVSDLWRIVKSVNLLGFCFLGPMPAFNEVLDEPYSEYVFERDPYVQAHLTMIHHVAAWVCENVTPPEPVAFVFDQTNKAASIQSRWTEHKSNFPLESPCMGTLAPLDDRQSPAVQMGDLIANTAKRAFEDKMHDPNSALETLKKSCGQNLTWVGGWNEEYLRELREVSLDVATRPTPLAFEYKPASK
jgi:hypothetical protein